MKITKLKNFGVIVEPLVSGQHVSDLNTETLRTLFREHQLVALRGFRTFGNSEEFADYCERFGAISLWPFGRVLELLEQEKPQDHIFDSNYVPMHWDGMYRPQVPEYQIFHCVKAPLEGKGGRTTFSHTMKALASVGESTRALWASAKGIYQRKMEFYSSRTVSPILTEHPFRGYSVIRYNEPPAGADFLNPPDLEFVGAEGREEELHSSLKAALYAEENFYAHEWQDGDIVIADNFSLLHGREGFVSKSPRHIQRVHVLSATPFDNPGLESYS